MTTRGFCTSKIRRISLGDFGALPISTVIRPTRFYTGLSPACGTIGPWTTGSRGPHKPISLRGWQIGTTNRIPLWGLHRAERSALVELNVPHFTTISDGHALRDVAGTSIDIQIAPGLERAHARLSGLTDDEIDLASRGDSAEHRPAPAPVRSRDIGPLPSVINIPMQNSSPRQTSWPRCSAGSHTQCDERGVDRP